YHLYTYTYIPHHLRNVFSQPHSTCLQEQGEQQLYCLLYKRWEVPESMRYIDHFLSTQPTPVNKLCRASMSILMPVILPIFRNDCCFPRWGLVLYTTILHPYY